MRYYSIMPTDTSHLDEICEDIKYQIENGIADCPLFSMTLVPEGVPPVNKAEIMCKAFRPFKERLHKMGLKCGILVQATIGHGSPLASDFAFQHVMNFNNGAENTVVCPFDEGFREYIKGVMRTLASEKPDVIMVDDDFRLYHRSGLGCGCPLHMKRFNEKAGTSFTREELYKLVSGHTCESRRLKDIYISVMGESLVGATKAMREGIDEVDPIIPGVFCGCGNNLEFASEIARILAGKGNPVSVRINNGNYLCSSGREFSKVFHRAALQIAHLGKVDIIMDETDTCPQNRYSTSAQVLHAHHVGSIFEGVVGAKHWITRLRSYEPLSGKAYRQKLAENRGFYDALARLVPTLKWRGARIPISGKPAYYFGDYNIWDIHFNAWGCKLLERLGIPMFYSSAQEGVAFLDGDIAEEFEREDIEGLLQGKAVISSVSAAELVKMGYGDMLGVDIRAWKGLSPRKEILCNGSACNVQPNVKEIITTSDKTAVLSTVYHTVDGENMIGLFPGVTLYENVEGGKIAVFSGSPECEFNYTQPFSYLCEERKKQLLSLLRNFGELPVYYPDDGEVYLRAADMEDGGIFCAMINLGLDPLDEIPLVFDREVKKLEIMDPKGQLVPCNYSIYGDRIVISSKVGALDTLALIAH